MAAGTPVLAYRRGSMPELISNGETGYLIENEDHMIDMIQQIDTLDRAGCRDWVRERFSVGQMVDSYERLYKMAMRKRQQGSILTPSNVR